MTDKTNPYQFDLTKPRTIWMCELHRPVMHEHRTDGTVITHIYPNRTGKSALVSELLEEFRGRETARLKNP